MRCQQNKLFLYSALMRLDKPIGLFLLLWPTLWALWLAGAGQPHIKNVIIFVMGAALMRTAGCVINDVFDQQIDRHVARTRNRPLATGKISSKEALILFSLLIFMAFLLVLLLNRLTMLLAFMGAALTIVYPLLKRLTYLPQVGLGVAFAWGVLMAFAAENNAITPSAWCVFLAAVIWPTMYDTLYAMMDRQDDIVIGVKSTAILFGKYDRLCVGILQTLFIVTLFHVGNVFKLHWIYFFSLWMAAFLFFYQQWLIRKGERDKCFRAFLNNNWVGAVIFMGIAWT